VAVLWKMNKTGVGPDLDQFAFLEQLFTIYNPFLVFGIDVLIDPVPSI
jgi:hypothetical protein